MAAGDPVRNTLLTLATQLNRIDKIPEHQELDTTSPRAGLPAANLIETKILVNRTISDARDGARFMSADIKDYFLATPIVKAEYMKVQYKHTPEDIR